VYCLFLSLFNLALRFAALRGFEAVSIPHTLALSFHAIPALRQPARVSG
jgi:hypothetical protein